MKPLMLQGHERAITQIKYNREGDLLFSSAKDNAPNVWFALNGERLGSYNGHQGVVWCFDVNWETTRFLTGAGDNSLRLWDVSNGKEIGKVSTGTSVRTCMFSYSANTAVFSTDKRMNTNCEIHIIDVRNADASLEHQDPIMRIPVDGSKVTSILWGPLDETIISGHEDGKITMWDLKMGKEVHSVHDHAASINDLQFNKDGTHFVSASKDCTAKLFDTDTLECLKTYKTERPVNSAALSPIMDHVVLGGGQEAMEVTTTSTRVGKFDARFFHLVFEEEFGRVKGHFGPINSLAFHPDGKSYASGGEDGFTRVHTFDPSYFEYQFDF